MLMTDPSKPRALGNARLVAQAALILAERAYAEGNSEEAAHLVDVAHRLFGAVCDWPRVIAQHAH